LRIAYPRGHVLIDEGEENDEDGVGEEELDDCCCLRGDQATRPNVKLKAYSRAVEPPQDLTILTLGLGNVRGQSGGQRALTYVLFVIVVVIASQFILDASFGGSPVYVVVSSSMVPTLKIGDLVIVHGVPYSSIRGGDVIVYVTPSPNGGCAGLVVVHRVVGIGPDGGLITQGDNRQSNPTPDEPFFWPYVHDDCVRGKVIIAIPYLGLVSRAFPPPINYVIVAIILLFVFLTEFRKGRHEDQPKRDSSESSQSELVRSLTCLSP
jgi:signal peptidase